MVEIIKEFDYCKCEFRHNKKNCVLTMYFKRLGKNILISTIIGIKWIQAKKFIDSFTEQNAKEMVANNMTCL